MITKKWVVVVTCLIGLLLFGAYESFGARVFIERVGGYDAQLVNLAKPLLVNWIEASGNTPTTQRQSADYMLRFSITDATVTRSFNWWVLLLPLWPVIPVTTVNANVVVSVTITGPDGREVFTDTAGGEAGRWIFGDFYSNNRVKRDAFNQAFRRVMVSAYLP